MNRQKSAQPTIRKTALDRITAPSFKDSPSTHWAIGEIEAAVTAQRIKNKQENIIRGNIEAM